MRMILPAVAMFVTAMTLATSLGAETRLERGRYLMESIVACGNCHTPQGPKGPLPGMELAGGLKIEHKGFTASVPTSRPTRRPA